MSNHETLAAEIAASSTPAGTASNCTRQGDVVMRRIGDASPARHLPTPDGGVLISAGRHGEHRLIGDAVHWGPLGTVSIQGHAVLVHTDVPSARHGSVVIAPGTWNYTKLRELAAGDVVQEVQD